MSIKSVTDDARAGAWVPARAEDVIDEIERRLTGRDDDADRVRFALLHIEAWRDGRAMTWAAGRAETTTATHEDAAARLAAAEAELDRRG